MPLPSAIVGQSYATPVLGRSDLTVYRNDWPVRSDLRQEDDGFVYTIPASEISEIGSLSFRTPNGSTVEAAEIGPGPSRRA